MALNNRRGCQKSNEKYYIFSWTKNLTNQLQNKSVKHTYKDQEIVRMGKPKLSNQNGMKKVTKSTVIIKGGYGTKLREIISMS